MTVPHYVIVGPSEEERAENLARARADCIAQELVTYEEIRDEFFSKEELTGMGWVEHPVNGCWAPSTPERLAEIKRYANNAPLPKPLELDRLAAILSIVDELRRQVISAMAARK